VSYLPTRDETNEVIGVSVAVVDVSERKQAERAMRMNDEEHRYMLELHPQAMWTMDAQGGNLEVRRPAVQMTGFGDEWTRNLGWLEAVHQDDVQLAMATMKKAVGSVRPLDIEYRVRSIDGEWRWMRSRGSPCFDASGKIHSWFGCIEDIDDQKQLEEDLHKSQTQLRSLFEGVRSRLRFGKPPRKAMSPAA